MSEEKKENVNDANLEWEKYINSTLKRSVPTEMNLVNSLSTRTKDELDNIRYNLKVEGASRMRKQEMAEAIAKEVVPFFTRWVSSIGQGEYDFLKLLAEKGVSPDVFGNEFVPCFLMSMGFIHPAGQEINGKREVVYYMPEELREIWKKIDSGALTSLVDLNTEVVRLTSGLLFYYGYVDFETLYKMVTGYLDKAQLEMLTFQEFIEVMYNADGYSHSIRACYSGMKYINVNNEISLEKAQKAHPDIDYHKFGYEEVYNAGEDNYIDATPEYKALAQYIMNNTKADVLKAAEIVNRINLYHQYGASLNEINEDILQKEPKLNGMTPEIVPLLINYLNNTRLWMARGNTPNELDEAHSWKAAVTASKKKKIGRNEPCPCGSGKKYKNCCGRNV